MEETMEEQYHIAICDDEEFWREKIKTFCMETSEKLQINFKIFLFRTGEELIQSDQVFQVLFLDVELGNIDGFEIGLVWKKQKRPGRIIYITSHDEWVQQAFKVQAFRYLYKDSDMEAGFQEALTEALREYREENDFLVFSGKKEYFIKIKDIQYIESLGDEMALHLEKDYIIVKETLKGINKRLDQRFYQCHKSYIVNMQNILKLENDKVYLKHGETVAVSVRRRKEMKKQYFQFIKSQAEYL